MGFSCDKSFASNYMVLKPEEACLFELSKLVFCRDVRRRKFVEYCCRDQGDDDEAFERRFIIFVSVLVQKGLQAMAKPLAEFGSTLENWLNLLSLNRGFFALVINSLTGKVVHPDKASASFKSILGYVDTRIELDYNMSNKDARYFAALSIMAAKISYENHKFIESIVLNHWKMDFLGSYDFWNDYQEKATTQAFMVEDKKSDVIMVAFRGTEPFDADSWCSDLDLSWYHLPGLGKVHGGFLKALGLQKSQGWPARQDGDRPETAYYAIRKLLKERLLLKNDSKTRFIVTGHSLGGALAVLFPAILFLHQEWWLLDKLSGIYTFGQPRVGDQEFAVYMERAIGKHGINYYRCVYGYDMVPRLPWDNSTLMFKHFGPCIYYNSFYQGKVIEESPDKNYFSVIWVIPKMVNAFWELMRSFIISYAKGEDYKEGFVLRMMRVIGLFSPGLSAHAPQDYVNSTRLGSFL